MKEIKLYEDLSPAIRNESKEVILSAVDFKEVKKRKWFSKTMAGVYLITVASLAIAYYINPTREIMTDFSILLFIGYVFADFQVKRGK